MTDIDAKALALVNEIEREEGENELTRRIMRGLIMDEALCRAIEQHEATKQELSDYKQQVSDAALKFNEKWSHENWFELKRLIIPAPKPDPLVEVLKKLNWYDAETEAADLRAALDAAGFEIREKGEMK